MRAAFGISRTFCQSFLSGAGVTVYVHMNVTGCRAIFVEFSRGQRPRLQSPLRLAQRVLNGTLLGTKKLGGVVEWLMAPVLKTGRAQALVGSNPTPSAKRNE